MELTPLSAISPIDGRYRNKTQPLAQYFSEFGLIKYRVLVEVEYFISLVESGIPQLAAFPKNQFELLRNLYKNFSEKDAESIKETEKITNHDVKAVEYFLRDEFDKNNLGEWKEFIHFGLTSQDVNNTAIPLSLKNGITDVIISAWQNVLYKINNLAAETENIPMLAHTHGQPASPTRLGKEILVFSERLSKELSILKNAHYHGKFGGATGNFNAHYIAYQNMDWQKFGDEFLKKKLGLVRNQFTTQIDHYDDLARIFDNLRRMNVIMIDFCRDVWAYISMEYFRQRVNKNEVGSSAMPHKVNPIDFENAEGNFGFANAIFDHLSNKLPVSRLQRDLTDSTVLRNIGVPLAHTLISLESVSKGLEKLIINSDKMHQDLENNWAVVAEAIQTILRRESYPNPYEKRKQFSRGKDKLGKEEFAQFINELDVNAGLKEELLKVTPHNYTGV